MHTLRPAERAMVAIVRAVQDQEGEQSGVLVLDEPTASLPRAEVARLMGALNRFARNGQTILLVSHRLNEVIDIADRATVLRDGRLVGTLDGGAITENHLIELIAGRALDRMYPEMPAVTTEEVALELKALTGGPLRGVDLQLRKGEVLGIAGLLGSGRSELLKMIFGAYPVRSGTIEIEGRPQRFRHIGQAMEAGVAYVPEDRGGEAVFPDLTLSENLAAAMVDRYWHGLRLHRRQADAEARQHHRRLPHPGVLGAPGDGNAVGRQPAEGDPGPLARAPPQSAAVGRTDPGRGRERQGGDLRPGVQGGRPGLLGAAGHQRLRGTGPGVGPRRWY